MANETSKPIASVNADNVLRAIYNQTDASITTNGFLVGKVGHKITRSVVNATTDDYSFYDGTTLLYTLRVTYNNASHDEIDQAERIA